MAYSQFEPYRRQVEEWKTQGMTKMAMLKLLHEKYPEEGFMDKKSTFYPFVDSINANRTPNGLEQFLLAVPESLDQLHGGMQRLMQALKENEDEAESRHEVLMRALSEQKPASVIPQVMPSQFQPFNVPMPGWDLPRARRSRIRKAALVLAAISVMYFIDFSSVSKYVSGIWNNVPSVDVPARKQRL